MSLTFFTTLSCLSGGKLLLSVHLLQESIIMHAYTISITAMQWKYALLLFYKLLPGVITIGGHLTGLLCLHDVCTTGTEAFKLFTF